MTMNDCISRQAVLGLAEKGILVGNHNYKSVCNAINELPSVAPKVIDDIKAEINEGIESYKNKDKAVMYGFMCALYIIDKHVEGWDK